MDNRSEIRDFLTSRRARITPERAGLTSYGSRRVPGLRRAEVAQLAGVSVEYYSRLERGNLTGVSDSVLDALARALHLDEAERAHLYDLARTAGPAARNRRRPAPQRVRPNVQRLLDAMTEAPAVVMNGRADVLAANQLGRALFAPVFAGPARPPNFARFNFLDPRARELWADWNRAADDTVALLHAQAGRDPYDKTLTDLIGELSTRSEEFRTRWAAHDVRLHRTGIKHFRHPVVGELHLTFEVLELGADDGLSVVAYGTEPGSASEDGLRLLASWSATQNQDAGTDAINQSR
ncbi:helix-turn-helix transcriptional regulator [Micromonospora sp. CPCC 205711]|uniref:helix-turn-helix transcriptional regulator n=1 Tax=Micromonospora sp. CPCC 205547 TaxID=3122400 RepID=UPI002FF3363C